MKKSVSLQKKHSTFQNLKWLGIRKCRHHQRITNHHHHHRVRKKRTRKRQFGYGMFSLSPHTRTHDVTSLLQRKVSSHLSVLKLCCVSASRKTANAVAEMLTRTAEFSTLEDLDLRNNRIDCIGASSIASSLSSIKSSSRLRVRLDANQIEDRGAASLLSALKFRPKSLQITLSQNETTSPILRSSFMMASKRSSAFHRTTATTPSFVLPEI